ncbi:MAG: ribokinase [Opitutaceae bacterium]|jgi:ribokinase
MSRILNLGSVNIDHVYHLSHFVRPGETLASMHYKRGTGGKGLNQSVALARAGAIVAHIGRIGSDGHWIRGWLREAGIECSLLETSESATGHAVIQVAPSGENSIILHAGANHDLAPASVALALGSFSPGDHFLCQNETSAVPESLAMARERGLSTWFNPAPFTSGVAGYPLECVDWLVLNETEGASLSGQTSPQTILASLHGKYPRARIVLTLGSAGVICAEGDTIHHAAPPPVRAMDTTAAGDTFIGYLAAGIMAGLPVPDALDRACRAAALSVTRPGAATSVPYARELA